MTFSRLPAHVNEWPDEGQHSNQRRPIIYRGSESGIWWVDDSGVHPDASDDNWDQSGFATWRQALEYALRMVELAREQFNA